ncbi:MAG: Spi family protease inhibitor [Alistipes sp.]|nr:Spi family protease inhibitor [Alistipes sp.]
MKRLLLSLAVVVVATASCQKDFVYNDRPKEKDGVELTDTRSYDEALKIAEDALSLLDGVETRSGKKRVIKRAEGQTVMRPVTRGSETTEEPIMYVFNNENDEGFTVVAANRSQQPLIAVTEQGNYTYGEPTGVEPFDLLMEDVAKSLSILPGEPLAIKFERENESHDPYGPLCDTQWGTGTIYGSLYPDGKAYDEAAAIAQAILCNRTTIEYTVTNPNDPQFGQDIMLNISDLKKHKRYDHLNMIMIPCNENIHNQIAKLYLEIGYRLSKGTTISLSNKLVPFSFAKTREVLAGFTFQPQNIVLFNSGVITPWLFTSGNDSQYRQDVFVFKGSSNGNLPDNTNSHTWIASGFDHYTYDIVEYTLNKVLNPSHPNPYGYTETDRQNMEEFMLYINWGFDGISNGWFYSGCFDMSQRIEDDLIIGGDTDEYDYNFSSIQYFIIPGAPPAV